MNKVTSRVKAHWAERLRFRVDSASGARTDFDGDKVEALSPMEALLSSLATCMGVDVVSILRKMRVDLRGLTIDVTGERNPDEPRYYRRIDLAFAVEGDVPREKIEKAIELSREKYCSVLHSLRDDLVVGHTIRLRSTR